MKMVANIVTGILTGVVFFLIIMSVSGRMDRSMELKSNLSSVVEETVEIMAVSKKYSIENTNEYLADLMENLAVKLDSNSELKVEIMNQDMGKGILSVRISEIFKHPNGEIGTVTCDRTVILNKLEKAVPKSHKVSFYVEGERYKVYEVQEGSLIAEPAEPLLEGRTFAGWIDGSGNRADFTQPVGKENDYFAEFY